MSVPSMMIEPLSGLSSPISALRKTDLPVPEGPSMTETSPAGIESVTSPQISCFPKDLVRSLTWISTPMTALLPLLDPDPTAARAHAPGGPPRGSLTGNNGVAAVRLRVFSALVTRDTNHNPSPLTAVVQTGRAQRTCRCRPRVGRLHVRARNARTGGHP